MQLDISESSLAVYEALASDIRLKIIQLLSKQKMNVKDLALELNLSSAIISKHIKKLEAVGIIKTERIPGISGLQKVSILKVDHIDIQSATTRIIMSHRHAAWLIPKISSVRWMNRNTSWTLGEWTPASFGSLQAMWNTKLPTS